MKLSSNLSYILILGFSMAVGPLANIKAQPEGFSKVENLEEVKTKMKSVGQNQQTIQSSFRQAKVMEYLDMEIQSSGSFWYAAPSKVRWEYKVPYQYTIIINNNKLSLISGDNQNDFDAENSEIFEQINKLMIGSVTGDIFNAPDYNIEVFENPNQYFFKLTPLDENMAGVISGIEMLLDKSSGVVTEIKMIEGENNHTKISFSNTKINEPIPENTFVP